MSDVIRVEALRHQYGRRVALDDVRFAVPPGGCVGLLGPNGGGKTTLFRILTTLLTPTAGRALVCGLDTVRDRHEIRSRIGVVFQFPSLDVHLTARENLRHAGHLYGLSGTALDSRIDECLSRLAVLDRAGDLVKTLSGGLRRRVELAKCLLHRPAVLILDEPSAGLDPAARKDLWTHLHELRRSMTLTLLLTTHHMDDAERCDALIVLDRGRVVAEGGPAALKARIGGDCVTITCRDPSDLSVRIARELGFHVTTVDGTLRIEGRDGRRIVAAVLEQFGDQIEAVTIGRPTLEDVFVHATGHRFGGGEETGQ